MPTNQHARGRGLYIFLDVTTIISPRMSVSNMTGTNKNRKKYTKKYNNFVTNLLPPKFFYSDLLQNDYGLVV